MAFDAFSGLGASVNKKGAARLAHDGPIPAGTFYIEDCESGGFLGPLLDRLRGKKEWFALYAIDSAIDDRSFCKQVERGNFRLYPKGVPGSSRGCIVINERADFMHLRSILRSAKPSLIPGSQLSAYGRVTVR